MTRSPDFLFEEKMNNFTKCQKCGLSLIIEESESHQCRDVLDYRFEENILWLFDGENWYPRKLLSRRNLTERRTDDDLTEPISVNFINYGLANVKYN